MSNQEIENEIQAKGLNAPRITPAQIESVIAEERYVFPGRTPDGMNVLDPGLAVLTICVLRLSNGFLCTGESACASPENFDLEIGKRIARDNAVQKIWALEGYQLRTRLALAGQQGS